MFQHQKIKTDSERSSLRVRLLLSKVVSLKRMEMIMICVPHSFWISFGLAANPFQQCADYVSYTRRQPADDKHFQSAADGVEFGYQHF
ncbi:hypothetical protein ANAEL_01696 [Anaerolineales bacterium]|nr:hypothetical protein ANAEL_01696 [Anaerolineales bacterium]